MPCHSMNTDNYFSALTPMKYSFGIQELLGHSDDENPATFGIFALEKGHPVSFDKLPFHSYATVTEGEMVLEDLDNPEEVVHVKAGGILHVPSGSSARWSTPTNCKGTFLHTRAPGDEVLRNGLY